MKKVICLVIAVMMIVVCTFSVSAAEFHGYDNVVYNDQNQSNGTLTVESRVYSHFTITFPDVIDTSNPNDGAVTVSDSSLEDDYIIKVGIDNLNENGKITMNHKTKEGVTANLTLNGNYTRVPNDPDTTTILTFTGDGTEYISTQMDYNAVAGSYQGTVVYSINCVPNN